MKPKAVVAMSGGVDSSVAAALMKDAGYDVVGIMLKLWKGAAANNESGCCSLDAAEDARRVAQVLDIPFYVFNFADRFSQSVIVPFTREYSSGRTPNPCVECNRSIKFAALAERAKAFGAEALATGHYARIAPRGRKEGFRLLRGVDRGKDQSYVLYMLGQEELELARFPVGEYKKEEIREIASSLGLRNANKPESQEICFVPNGDSHAFLESEVPEGSRPGAIVSAVGERIGTHRGFAHYTVGQRRGLGVGVGVPLYVKEVRRATNEVVVDVAENLEISELDLEAVSLVSRQDSRTFRASVMTRYRGPELPATIHRMASMWRVVFDFPHGSPVAPGQAAVFYGLPSSHGPHGPHGHEGSEDEEAEQVLGGGTVAAAR